MIYQAFCHTVLGHISLVMMPVAYGPLKTRPCVTPVAGGNILAIIFPLIEAVTPYFGGSPGCGITERFGYDVARYSGIAVYKFIRGGGLFFSQAITGG